MGAADHEVRTTSGASFTFGPDTVPWTLPHSITAGNRWVDLLRWPRGGYLLLDEAGRVFALGGSPFKGAPAVDPRWPGGQAVRLAYLPRRWWAPWRREGYAAITADGRLREYRRGPRRQ